MNNRLEFDLLAEIARLLKKYGPETFDSLAENLAKPEFSERLAELLSTTGKAARKAQATATRNEQGRSPRDFRSSLLALRESDPEQSALLVRLYDDLAAKTVLPTLRDVRAFASDAGLSPTTATSRDKAVIPLIKALMSLPTDDIRSRLATIRPVSADDRSLEGWSNLILDSDQRRNSPQEQARNQR